MPADMPGVIEWRQASGIVLVTLPRNALEAKGSNGETNIREIGHQYGAGPIGATHWRTIGSSWLALESLPDSWRAWLLHLEEESIKRRPKVDALLSGRVVEAMTWDDVPEEDDR